MTKNKVNEKECEDYKRERVCVRVSERESEHNVCVIEKRISPSTMYFIPLSHHPFPSSFLRTNDAIDPYVQYS